MILRPLSSKRRSFPPRVVALAVCSPFRFSLRLRLAEKMLLERGALRNDPAPGDQILRGRGARLKRNRQEMRRWGLETG